MSTGVLIVLIVIIVAALVIGAVALNRRAAGPHGPHHLKRRFGPEYDRVVSRHDGDTKAADRELAERVQRHGDLRERPLDPAERERFTARWAAAQEQFVESPHQAVADADLLLRELAGARGFPSGGEYEEQFAALSVHHAEHVHGYRRVHSAAHEKQADTEEMRTAMIEARAFFDDLVDERERPRPKSKSRLNKLQLKGS
ncbi:hypothetical protein GCM10023084_02230 [Streptomyces lacrimifluminis]|uniref:Secreted protein n=1 Tax=Streptomyces lacrimifluminis TaxID=1500077 RepID=A0A917NRG2_9ACTN|nr:hypothetical protein [Streptomyces lacrimifluminis]GGJ21408.1 hypothetical protein GCM10012282_17310 [Streptomyces lacrimifluminis]